MHAVSRAQRSEARLTACGVNLIFGVGTSFGWCFWADVCGLGWPALCLLAGREAEAFAVHLQDMDMMGEAVEERAGKPFRAEDRGPFIEWQVAGDECGAAFIALTEDLEEQLRTDSRERLSLPQTSSR